MCLCIKWGRQVEGHGKTWREHILNVPTQLSVKRKFETTKMPLFCSFVQMLYSPTEKEMRYALGRPEQMFLDVNIREVSLAHWGVLKCARWPCSLPWPLTNHSAQNSSFLLNVAWLNTLEKRRCAFTLYLSPLSLSSNIIFPSQSSSHYCGNQYQLLPSLDNIYCSTLW